MAGMEWTRPQTRAVPAPTPALERISRWVDWEDLLTLGLIVAAMFSVSSGLENSSWTKDMPAITLVGVLAVGAALLLHRSGLLMVAAWPMAVITGALVTFWQALVMVGPGTFDQRLHAAYARFDLWFDVALHGGVSNDSLPFNVLIVAITWLGAFLFSWSVYRWHNAWIGLVPGGAALFIGLVFVTDELTGSIVLYLLFGFLLIMRTNLTAKIGRWRRDGTAYPSLISLTFLNFTAWLMFGLMAFAWTMPSGPFSTPAVVERVADGVARVGVDFVRLAGPLHTKKVIPMHSYTGVLPFQGSVNLGERELLTVKMDPTLQGPFSLRGAVYDEYESGGWEAGERTAVDLPDFVEDGLAEQLAAEEVQGQLIPLEVHVERKSVVGTVVFSAGQPVSTDESGKIEVPKSSITSIGAGGPRSQYWYLSDEEIAEVLRENGNILVTVQRGDNGRPQQIDYVDDTASSLPDTLVVRPEDRVRRGEFYNVTGFVPEATPEELRAAGQSYPAWIEQNYLQLPESLPDTVRLTAGETVGTAQTPYDKATAIEAYLRSFPIDYDVPDTPPGRDTVDYFLHDAKRGYFDYHASAMVVMLRTLGVPARLAVGFVVGEEDFDRTERIYTVRDRNSYAWAEVYFSGYGWISFNPTPDRPEQLAPFEREVPLPAGPLSLEDFPDLPVGADPIFDIFPESDSGKVQVVPGRSGGSAESYVPWYALGALGIAGLVVGAGVFGWQRSVAGLPYPQQTWEKMVRMAGWAGHGPEPGQTPTDYANSLQRSLRSLRGVSVITDAYNRSRFGHKAIPEDEREQIEELWRPMRNSLARTMFGRVLRRK